MRNIERGTSTEAKTPLKVVTERLRMVAENIVDIAPGLAIIIGGTVITMAAADPWMHDKSSNVVGDLAEGMTVMLAASIPMLASWFMGGSLIMETTDNRRKAREIKFPVDSQSTS